VLVVVVDVEGGRGLAGWLWASPSPSSPSPIAAEEAAPATSPLVEELRRLQTLHGDNLQVDYFVDEEGSFITRKTVRRIMEMKRGRGGGRKGSGGDGGTGGVGSDGESGEGSKVIMISGPEGFVRYFAGPKAWEEGREVQGPVGGLLGRLGVPEGWRVVKM